MERGWMLTACVLTIAISLVQGYYYSDLQCHKCRKAPNHAACNNGIEMCRRDYTACITKVEKKRGGKIEITKGCSKPKYCKDPQPNCNRKGGKCSFCCYHDMCNVGDWPPPPQNDPCGCKPCLNGGTCDRSGNKFKCKCPPGFSGRYCENKEDKPDPCKPDPCKNGGSCWSCNGNWNCNCPPSYTGKQCETSIDPCKPENPCMNGGQCNSKGGDYTCRCKPGFNGEHCEHEKNACASKPCQNGGTCQNHWCSYTCLCPPSFTGDNCQTEIGGGCFRCPTKDGLFPDRYNCRKFYHCSNRIPYHKNCPAQLHFNPGKKVCDWPWAADCVAATRSKAEEQKYEDTCGGSCFVEQSSKRGLEEEEEDTFVWEEEEEEEEERRVESAREFIEENEQKIDSILDALVEIEAELRNTE